MPIIDKARLQKKEKIKVEINGEIFNKINDYCVWANISDVAFFIEEAANFVFAKDKEWKKHNKSIKNKQARAE
ncbi:Uncharacterised protein [Legionella busanensis]|uniref:Uncharacterized protein n=1 Tax=Legionella busanensis TaxID=190655 RepID=A0A378JMI4_9GAMM|nr:hypothetical protein [Legionella busanensis]STX51898.1 Uncharacterised protein [Legionella busanensis]